MADYRIPGEFMYRGMLLVPCLSVESIQNIIETSYVEGDILITSYPKTGTTWMEEVTWLVTKHGDLTEAMTEPLWSRMLFMEHSIDGIQEFDLLKDKPRPAIMKSHLPASILEGLIKEGTLKIIVQIRNPKDTLVSMYHFYRMNVNLGNYKGTWNEFFELYKAKHLVYGDYFDWYASWLPYLDLPNVLMVSYEDMKTNMTSVIHKLSSFLGKSLSEDQIKTIIKHTSFESMKTNKLTDYTGVSEFRNDISPFMRKGVVGDWKNYFSEEQSKLVDDEYKKRFVNNGLVLQF